MSKTVTVNGCAVEWEEQMTIQRLLEKVEFNDRIFIVKMNDDIIKKDLYNKMYVPEHARITIIKLVAGG